MLGVRRAVVAEALHDLRRRTTSKQAGTSRRVDILKEQGKFRTLQIPCIRDRVVQGALKLILEAIFEADFCPNSYEFRPKRSPHRALAEVGRSLRRRMTTVIDVDLAKCFDSVRHDVLLGKIARRVQDPKAAELRSGLAAGTPNVRRHLQSQTRGCT
jgi:RNA-directed DNA polymerase